MLSLTRKRTIQRRKIYEDVADYLIDDIKNGVYKVGEPIPSERALMAEFAVGRPAIRESLAKLARMGFIEVRPGLRAKVCPVNTAPLMAEMTGTVAMTMLSKGGQKNMQEIRLLFETAVGRAIATTITDEQIQDIEMLQSDSESALVEPERFAAMDVLFHRALGKATNNPLVTAVYDAFGTWLLDQRLKNFKKTQRPRIAFTSHGEIVEALKTRCPDKVEKAIRDHLEDVATTYWSIPEDSDEIKEADAFEQRGCLCRAKAQ